MSGLEETPAKELQTCLRDLMGLLALPSLWSGREPVVLFRTLAEALEGILSIDVCHVAAIVEANAPPLALMRVRGSDVASTDAQWSSFAHTHLAAELREQPTTTLASTPLGELRITRLAMNYSGHVGILSVGATRNDFPRPVEIILLRAAASLAASGLRTARLVQERENALRAKDEFLAMLGHELRNPLAPIVTALSLMKLRGDGELTREQAIIERQVGNLTELVDDLLDVARVTRGKIELKKSSIDIASIVSKAVETAKPLLEKQCHRLAVEIDSPVPRVYADPMRLTQVVANLLVNAAKYTSAGGEIVVRATQRQGQLRVSIQDNGIGIDRELLPRVFDLFQQGRVTTDRAAGGLGIGLAIVKSLVELHGGSVTAFSEGLGHGSEFSFTLPLQVPETSPALDAAPKPIAGARQGMRCERVLVVDDNHDAADMVAEYLKKMGHETAVAFDAPQALSLSESFKPTVMVLDIGLPVIDGYDLALMMRERWGERAPRMIALTGYGLAHDRSKSRQAGLAVHLVKPVRLESLLDAIVGESTQTISR